MKGKISSAARKLINDPEFDLISYRRKTLSDKALRLAEEIKNDPAKARKFLQDWGIIDADGKVAKEYGGEDV